MLAMSDSNRTIWEIELDFRSASTESSNLCRSLELAKDAESREQPQEPQNGLGGRQIAHECFNHDGRLLNDQVSKEARVSKQTSAWAFGFNMPTWGSVGGSGELICTWHASELEWGLSTAIPPFW